MLVLAKLGARIWISCIVVSFGAVTLGKTPTLLSTIFTAFAHYPISFKAWASLKTGNS